MGKIKNQYAGKTRKEVWTDWSESQRDHFIDDHKDNIYLKYDRHNNIDLPKKEYDELPSLLQNQLAMHIQQGQYKEGGLIIGGVEGEMVKGDAIDYHELKHIETGSPFGGDYFVAGKYGYAQSGYGWFKFKLKDLKKKSSGGSMKTGGKVKTKKLNPIAFDLPQDYEFVGDVANELRRAGIDANARFFDKYQGAYIIACGEKFWVKEVYSTGEKSESPKKYKSAKLIDFDGEYSANAGDYFQSPDDFVFEEQTLILTKQDGEQIRINDPKKSDLPKSGEVDSHTFTYKKGTSVEHIIFSPESEGEEGMGYDVTISENGNIDASELIDYCKAGKMKKGGILSGDFANHYAKHGALFGGGYFSSGKMGLGGFVAGAVLGGIGGYVMRDKITKKKEAVHAKVHEKIQSVKTAVGGKTLKRYLAIRDTVPEQIRQKTDQSDSSFLDFKTKSWVDMGMADFKIMLERFKYKFLGEQGGYWYYQAPY